MLVETASYTNYIGSNSNSQDIETDLNSFKTKLTKDLGNLSSIKLVHLQNDIDDYLLDTKSSRSLEAFCNQEHYLDPEHPANLHLVEFICNQILKVGDDLWDVKYNKESKSYEIDSIDFTYLIPDHILLLSRTQQRLNETMGNIGKNWLNTFEFFTYLQRFPTFPNSTAFTTVFTRLIKEYTSKDGWYTPDEMISTVAKEFMHFPKDASGIENWLVTHIIYTRIDHFLKNGDKKE